MKLIVNADDFGLTTNVSLGILHGMKTGIISDTSAIVSACDFKESALLALSQNVTTMGVHCLLTMGRPILNPEEVPSLVDEHGQFYTREGFKQKDVNLVEVKRELEAQIQTFLLSGLQLNHLDTHHGFMHKSEAMTRVFIELAHQYQVPLRYEAARKERAHDQHLVSEAGVIVCDDLYFNQGIPYHTIPTVVEYLERVKDSHRCVEIGCHPGWSDEKLRQYSVLNDDRERELEVFTSPQLLAYVRQHSIDLVSYSSFRDK